ncbi:uncharacterized protein LOC112050298 [Bicyclus anynana]|uniref:Uncharacterized protein LOC112050298 n=1 Tax=Bicyclus anynana TaxID=110368 RepID=A0ABM3M100_BICAN|nr:uncharacterized protein LOC112050298 [Bicyclus anynana]
MSSSTALLVICSSLLLAGYVVGTDSKFNVTIVNDEPQTPIYCPLLDSCRFTHLACKYIAYLRKQPITRTYSTDLESAKRDLKSSNLDAVLHFNENFTDTFVAKMALGEDADTETLQSSQLKVWTVAEPADALRGYLQAAFDEFVEDIKKLCDLSERTDEFSFKDPIGYYSV